MTSAITVPSDIKTELYEIASASGYPQVLEILSRGSEDEIVVESLIEAQAIVNVARSKMLEALLKYPYWDDTSTPYDEEHEEAFQEVQMGLFEKVASYIGQEYDVETKV